MNIKSLQENLFVGGGGLFLVLHGRDIEHFDGKLASVAEEGVRVEEDAGCHAARRPGAGPRPGLFSYVVV